MSKDKALAAMLENPTLIKRPVIESRKFIAVGFYGKALRRIFSTATNCSDRRRAVR